MWAQGANGKELAGYCDAKRAGGIAGNDGPSHAKAFIEFFWG
jgi:hypothetical protein